MLFELGLGDKQNLNLPAAMARHPGEGDAIWLARRELHAGDQQLTV